jgi:hypothetical protein
MNKLKKDKKIKKGKVAVIRRKGEVIHRQKADEKGLLIEYPEGDEITEKNEADLPAEENGKFKNK